MKSATADPVALATDGRSTEAGMLRHSHHYDAALHRAITETGVEKGRSVLERAAASASYRAVRGSASARPSDTLRDVLGETGLGTVTLAEVTPTRAEVILETPSGFAAARLEMFGKASAPACDITRGVISGALGALFGAHFSVEESDCVAAGQKRCRFVATLDHGGIDLDDVPPLEWPALLTESNTEHLIEGAKILELIDASSGSDVPAYGKLWAEMYARAAFEFEQEIPRSMGSKFGNLASVVLTEAAHLGTFYSIGGLLRSQTWKDQVASIVPEKQDWVEVLIDLANKSGWGTWSIQSLIPGERLTVRLVDGYEAASHLQLGDGPAATPKCYFARGFAAALMNVIFAGDILLPDKLTQTVYNSLFRSPTSYRSMETRCGACGERSCEFVATPLSPGILRF